MAATMLTATELSQRFGSELIFSGVSFRILERERIALVGTNGSGKSSLLKILAGLAQPTEGTIDRSLGLRVTYQAQESRFQNENSLYEETLDAFREVRAIGQQMAEIEQQMATGDDEHLERVFDEYGRLSAEYEARHGYEMEHRTAQVLGGLGFPEDMFDEPVARLSGGQKTRVALAKALLSEPDLLLLDEPTNHLDLQAIEWLEGFLRGWNRSFVIVSHDRYFLDQVTERTLELAFGRLEDYPGNYSRFLELRAERHERQQKEYEAQQDYIRRTEEFIRRYKAGQRTREARGRETRLARLERIEAPREHQRLNARLDSGPRAGQIVLRSRDLVVGFPRSSDDEGVQLVNAGEIVIERGDRVAIAGPNGSGKTSLLRTIVGEIQPLAGSVSFGTNVLPAYYAQAHERLDPNRTALDTILKDQPIGEEQARSLLGRFLFSDDDVFKQVRSLSGGERSRLALARLSLERANFLILDEPTNHLDILARESLEGLLSDYDGTLLFVSHDRFFIDKIATKVWSIEEGVVVEYLGNYSDMVRKRGSAAAAAPEQPQPQQQMKQAQETRASRPDRRNDDRRIRKLQRDLAVAEREVDRLEQALNQLSDELAAATSQQDTGQIAELGVRYEAAQQELERAYSEWNAIGAELDGLLIEVGSE